MSKIKSIYVGLLVIIITLAGYALVRMNAASEQTVSSFAECEKMGGRIAESYPRQCFLNGKSFIELVDAGTRPSDTTVAVTGVVSCLPKTGTGAQTLECAMGLKTDDGKYYGLRGMEGVDPNYTLLQDGKRLDITGELTNETMTGPDGNAYDVAGIIDVATATETN